ncbi:sugar ABC transporter permease [Paenibacillus sp. GP183]|jgi:sn-glycerol 3-phosphate transport system permease protein|uniref:carbohydrate ABC transporter permease n=1 Tax=Paenibacillus sp. GP183 TaxID=1882751 RepID=UPI000899B9AB|nr:sugar ABC transporter permease [Paenibacillus sp. GP183]SEC29316.1 carbohydrate ABC transporter membrane protein 1, CUT1 family [Paenibacillus sp. GP183]
MGEGFEQELLLKKRKQERTNFWKGMLYILPSLILFLIFVIYPFIQTIIQSLFLSDNRGFLTKFVAFQNYTELFNDPVYLTSIKATFLYTLITVPLTIVISLFLAVISIEKLKGMGIFQTIFSSTMGVSVAAGSVFWSFLFHPTVGILNKLIAFFGGAPIGWLTSPSYAMLSVSLVSVWMNIGFSYLVLIGGLKNIDSSYYQSADIVGGGFWFKLRKITIPLLSPTLFFVLTISIIYAFQSFGVIDMLTRGGPVNSTNLLVYSIYTEAFVNFQYGSATAQGVVLFIMIFIVSRLQIKLTERWVTYQ